MSALVERKVAALPKRSTVDPEDPKNAYEESLYTRYLTDKEVSQTHRWMWTERTRNFVAGDAIQRQFDVEQIAMHFVAKERELRRLRRNAADRLNRRDREREPRASTNHDPHNGTDEANSQRPPTPSNPNLEEADRVPGSPPRDTSSRAKKDSSSGD